MAVQTQIQARRGTAATWTSTNPTLAAGETGYETDTGRFKIGTGSTAWASLGYFNRDPLTTKGDLYTFSTTDDRLAVGANGESLVADSSTSTGLRYTAGTVQANPIINSSFQNWQRGTTGTTTGGITYPSADRWNAWTFAAGGSVTLSRQVTGDTTNLPNIQYCGRFQRVAGNTDTGILMLGQALETINSIPFAGKTVTISFYARKGANYSDSTGSINAQLYSATTTDTSLNGLQAVSTVVAQTTSTLTATWQRFTATGTIGATSTQLAFVAFYGPTGTAGANDYFEITGTQIDIGSVALPFRTYAGTIQGELAACQRYYYEANNYQTGFPAGTTDTNRRAFIQFPVQMRTIPSTYSITVDTGTPTADQASTIGFRAYSAVGNTTSVAYFGLVKASAEL